MAIVGTGNQASAANKKESSTTYGDAVVLLGANDKLSLLSEGLTLSKNLANDDELLGNAGRRNPETVGERITGDLLLEGVYQGLEGFTMQALGFSHPDNSPVDVNGDATVFKHLFEIDDNTEIEAFKLTERNPATGFKIRNSTLAFDKQISVWEYLSTRVESITIEAGTDVNEGLLQVSLNLNAKTRSLNIGSGTNNLSTVASWTLPASSKIKFQNLVFRLRPVDEFTITAASNDTLQFLENGVNQINITVDAGVFSGQGLANEIASLMTQGTANSIKYKGFYNQNNQHKFTFTNTNNAITFNMDISDSTMDGLLGYFQDQTAALTITGDTGGLFDSNDLDANDKRSITSFTFTLNNNNANDDQTNDAGLNIEEPVRNNKFTTTLGISLSRYENNDIQKFAEEDTKLICDLRFTGSAISGGKSEEFNIIIPEMQGITDKTNIADAGLIRPDFSFVINEPQKDFIPGLDENGETSDSEYDKFTISEVGKFPGVSNTIIHDMVVFQGELFIGTGNTDAILAKYNFDTDTLTDSFNDFTAYTKVTALAVGFDKLWIAVQDGTDADIFSFDGTTFTLETAAEFSTNLINSMFFSNTFGKIYVGLDDGDIFDFDSTPTFTQRQVGGAGTQTSVADFTETNNILFTVGNRSTSSIFGFSTNGTSFSYASLNSNSIFTGVTTMDGYVMGLNVFNSTQLRILRLEPITKTVNITWTNEDPIGGGQIKLFKDWLYASGEDSTNNAVLFRVDGHNTGSSILVKDNFGQKKITALEEYRGLLFIGTDEGVFSTGAELHAYRPLRSAQIEIQNTNSVNPIL